MKVLEHGGRIGRTLLFLPCTAEPVWAFAETIALLSEQWHVFQVVFDGHEPEEPGDFTSVEQTVDEVTEYLKAHGIARLDAAYPRPDSTTTPRRKASVAACGRRHAEYTMILPYSHSPSVKSVAGNG